MRQNVLLIATVASFFGTLFLLALSIGLIAQGKAAYGLVVLLMGVPIAAGLTVVFDFIKAKLAITEDRELDIDIIKPKFTKFGGGG